MPYIKGAKEKEKALREIESILSSIRKATQFINSKYNGKEFKVSFFTPNDDYGYNTETYVL